MIEQEFLTEQPEEPADQEEQVGRIAGVNDVEPAREEHPAGEHECPGERDCVLHRVAGRPRCFHGQGVAEDVDSVDRFEFPLVAAPGRTDDRYEVACVAQCRRFLPHPAVERARQVLDQDQYPPGLDDVAFSVCFAHYQQIPS